MDRDITRLSKREYAIAKWAVELGYYMGRDDTIESKFYPPEDYNHDFLMNAIDHGLHAEAMAKASRDEIQINAMMEM